MHNLATKNFEPGIEEMLAEDIFGYLMRSHGIEADTVRELCREIAPQMKIRQLSHPASHTIRIL